MTREQEIIIMQDAFRGSKGGKYYRITAEAASELLESGEYSIWDAELVNAPGFEQLYLLAHPERANLEAPAFFEDRFGRLGNTLYGVVRNFDSGSFSTEEGGDGWEEVEVLDFQFEATPDGNVLWAQNNKVSIKATVKVTEGASEDFGYLAMRDSILLRMKVEKIDMVVLFPYDGQEQNLHKDADCGWPAVDVERF